MLLVADTGNESGGPLTMSQGCIYWISNGGLWTLKKTGGGSASAALDKQVNDAVDIASDSQNFYYTRANGEVWQRALSGSACDGSGPPEEPIAWGYTNIEHITAYGGTVAFSALGDTSNGYAGGGIFTTPAGGYDVIQIAPADKGVDAIAAGTNDIVYSTLDGSIHKVPK